MAAKRPKYIVGQGAIVRSLRKPRPKKAVKPPPMPMDDESSEAKPC